jgi:DNA repair exonuclease SbcCD nuclease subunit
MCVAVLISDIHFNLSNLDLASESLTTALKKAEDLSVPLVIAGDLQDNKAIIRAEIANRLINILKNSKVPIYLLVGNHDKINEKSLDHSLNYLRPYVTLVDSMIYGIDTDLDIIMLPYYSDVKLLKELLNTIPAKYKVIMHQGLVQANMGDYIQDKSALKLDDTHNLRIFSGHYHEHQTVGNFTYIGSPYTITFGEAKDPEKGFLLLNKDGTFTRELLKLRKHIVIDKTMDTLYSTDFKDLSSKDIIKLKIRGNRYDLEKLDKKEVGDRLFGHANFKLEKIVDDEKIELESHDSKPEAILDELIERSSYAEEQKNNLKSLWRQLLS